jgi:hypothetical protein
MPSLSLMLEIGDYTQPFNTIIKKIINIEIIILFIFINSYIQLFSRIILNYKNVREENL